MVSNVKISNEKYPLFAVKYICQGVKVRISNSFVKLNLKIVFVFTNSADPDKMLHCRLTIATDAAKRNIFICCSALC